MPGVVSKYMQTVIDRYEKAGGSRTTISKVLVTAAVASLVVKVTYPLVRNHLDGQKAKKCNNNDQQATNNNGHTQKYDKLQDSGGGDATKSEIDKVEQVLATARAKRHQQLPGLNMEFILQLKKLIMIMIPKPFCYETQLLAVHTLCLISRTFLSILVASMEGQMVKYIVKKDGRNFAMMLLKWLGIAGPATFVNSLIRFLENKLALAFRTRLVDHAYQMYFKNQTYYRVSNLDGRIENADHR
jgi:ATP-binding cassette, subfamily D (ALD), member 2